MRKFESLAVNLETPSAGARSPEGGFPPLERPHSEIRGAPPAAEHDAEAGSYRGNGLSSFLALIKNSPLEILALIGLGLYAFFFWRSVGDWWFNPEWTTDDALQQVYPFHKALSPELFQDDLITHMMEQYLTPLHYGFNWVVTLVTKDPIMSAHWGMLVQLVLTVGFVFAGVRTAVGVIPACFAAAWMLHTRHVVQRMTAGLPRGWAAPLFAAFFYFALKGNHRGVLLLILVGCFLHPPATFVIAGGYGLHMLWTFSKPAEREAIRRPLLHFIAASPVFACIAWLVVRMPADIGTMASYQVAAGMPEFSTPDGRFPFYPLMPVSWDLNIFAFQAFIARFYNPGALVRAWMPEFVVLFCLMLAAVGWRKKASIFPSALVCFLVSAAGVYFLSREFAFKLYVPNRHLQFPFAMFFVVGMTIATWRVGVLFAKDWAPSQSLSFDRAPRIARAMPMVMLAFLGGLIVLGSGSGLKGSANFNYSIYKKGGVFAWVAENTPTNAVIAGDPTLIDGLMLFGKRTAYITTETAHPFYDKYYAAVKSRIEVTLRAHYARTLEEFVQILEPAGVDYFIFDRKKFYPEALATAKYFKPFDTLVTQLTSGPVDQYAFRAIPRTVNRERFPALLYRDDFAVLVDVNELKAWLKERSQVKVSMGGGMSGKNFVGVGGNAFF